MEIDSDSGGSHISATPPRESKADHLLALASSYKQSRSKTRVRVSSSRSNPKFTSTRRITLNCKPKSKSKSKIKTEDVPLSKDNEPKPDPESEPEPPTPLFSPDLADFSGLPVPICCPSDRIHDVSSLVVSVKNLPAGFAPRFSKMGRMYSDPETTEKEKDSSLLPSVSIPQPQVVNCDQTEGLGNLADSISSETSRKSLLIEDPIKIVRKRHPNSIEVGCKLVQGGEASSSKSAKRHPGSIECSSQPLPFKRSKTGNEGNFVRLNINGYGHSNSHKFKNKRGKRSASYSSQSRRSSWKTKRKSNAKEGEDENDDLCDEDGLVLENSKQQQKQCKKAELEDELIEQAVSAARDDPSHENLTKLLKLSHGYDSFREGQLEAIKQVIAGKSTMLVLPTGAGKSLCYQLPSLLLPGITLVVSPLVALMVDQLRQLPPLLQGGLISSNQTSEEASDTVRQLLEGNLKVLFVSPERFLNAEFLSIFGPTLLVSLVVIDEAHCLSEWSHNFRPSYLRLRASLLRAKLNVDCILAMTATATTKTLQAVMCALEIPPTSLIHTSQIRDNLQLYVTLSGSRMKDLMTLMKSSPFKEVKSTIIYCKFQSETDMLSKYLCDNSISAKSYHSGIPAKDRSRTQELFCSNKIKVVVATVAFGMGLNKSDVGAVLHYSLPESLEEYVQEIGRAGRDGRLSYCHLLFDDITYFKLRSFLYSDGVDEYAVNKFLSHVFNDAKNSPGKIFSLVKESASQKFDMKEEVMLTVLTYLEIGEVQYLRLLPQLKVTCTMYFHKTSPAMLASNDIVVAGILKKAETKQGSYVFDIPTVANSVRVTMIDLSNHLQNLKSKGEVTYELKDLAFCYVVVKNPEDFCSLATHLTGWLSDVESCKVRKLDAMFNAATFAAKVCEKMDGCSGTLHTQCLQSRILDYFSREDDDPHFDFSNKMSQSSTFLRADIKVFLQSSSHAKFTPRAIARIMHGIASPAYPSSTWSKTHFWGRYSQIDFPVIMEAATHELMKLAGKHVL